MSVVRTSIAVIFALAVVTSAATAQVASPTIEGPIASPEGAFIGTMTFDLAQVGYERAEYFMSGTASAYTSTTPLGTDGIWSVVPSSSSGLRTRRSSAVR
jgi:hypothetical protein